MSKRLEVLFAPAEFAALPGRDLSQTVCVVFDVLRATSTMLTALANGAREILPVLEVDEALAIRSKRREVLLAGERNGLRIRADQTGGVDFDLGNSPREFTSAAVCGKSIVMTTTNGTRALRACAAARSVLIGTFLGLKALGHRLERDHPDNLLLVCSGTADQTASEDILGAGALCEILWPHYVAGQMADSAVVARQIFLSAKMDLLGAMEQSRNGNRLLGHPDLREDVEFCSRLDLFEIVAGLSGSGAVARCT